MDRNVRIRIRTPSTCTAINRPLHITRNRLVLRHPSFRDAEERRVGALYSIKPQSTDQNHNAVSSATKQPQEISETLTFCCPAGGILTNVPSAPFVKR